MSNPTNGASVDKSWLGGFSTSKPAFAYPDPVLTSIPMRSNMDNIELLQRQQKVMWPEFSWLTEHNVPDSRCYTMFSPDVSRIGYNRIGQVYSIICPQQGMWLGDKVCINVEVTVTGQRGWVDETTKTMAADMSVEARIWLSPKQGPVGDAIMLLLKSLDDELPLPIDKDHSIRILTHKPGDPDEPIFPLRDDTSPDFDIPDFATHHEEAYDVANLSVQIGEITKTHHPIVDEFNTLLMKAFNMASGNMLQTGNVLTWNVWFTPPEIVDQKEWKAHAALWRKSIEAHHTPPGGEGRAPRYFDGRPLETDDDLKAQMSQELLSFVARHADGVVKGPLGEKLGHLLENHGDELKDAAHMIKGMFKRLRKKK